MSQPHACRNSLAVFAGYDTQVSRGERAAPTFRPNPLCGRAEAWRSGLQPVCQQQVKPDWQTVRILNACRRDLFAMCHRPMMPKCTTSLWPSFWYHPVVVSSLLRSSSAGLLPQMVDDLLPCGSGTFLHSWEVSSYGFGAFYLLICKP